MNTNKKIENTYGFEDENDFEENFDPRNNDDDDFMWYNYQINANMPIIPKHKCLFDFYMVSCKLMSLSKIPSFVFK